MIQELSQGTVESQGGTGEPTSLGKNHPALSCSEQRLLTSLSDAFSTYLNDKQRRTHFKGPYNFIEIMRDYVNLRRSGTPRDVCDRPVLSAWFGNSVVGNAGPQPLRQNEFEEVACFQRDWSFIKRTKKPVDVNANELKSETDTDAVDFPASKRRKRKRRTNKSMYRDSVLQGL